MKDKIDIKELKKLADFMEERNLSEFELEVENFKIKLSKKLTNPSSVETVQVLPNPLNESPADTPSPQATEEIEEVDTNHYILSPMVGTFYRSPDPSSPAFVEVGESVKKSQTLCIIEAMKLMNEIESDIDGEVEMILVENGQSVEYGQRLFTIKSQ